MFLIAHLLAHFNDARRTRWLGGNAEFSGVDAKIFAGPKVGEFRGCVQPRDTVGGSVAPIKEIDQFVLVQLRATDFEPFVGELGSLRGGGKQLAEDRSGGRRSVWAIRRR